MSMHPARQAYVEEEEEGLTLSNVPTDTEYTIPASAPGLQSAQTSSILADFKRKREAAAIAVPTDDRRVRSELRSRGEPITLFGERPEDRRDRLRQLLYEEQGGDEDESMGDATPAGDGEGDEEVGEFYTEGLEGLLEARQEIARYSLPRAQQRIAHQKIESSMPVAAHVRHRNAIKAKLEGFELFGSQIASERPMSMVRFAPNNEIVATGDWGGSIKILDVPNLETQRTLRGHKGMIGGIDWVPGATLPESGISPESINLASGGGDADVHLWNLTQETPLGTLSGHTARVCRTAFHPSGAYLASASYDTTWRLWSLATQQELLLQEGHSKEVYAVSFSPDGSLLASAGLDSIGRVWDLRTGRTVMLLEGHVAPIYAVEWGVDGVRCGTGSGDGFAKVWDLRAVREVASIGAHRGGVSDMRWFRGTDGPHSGQIPQLAEPADVTMTNGDSPSTSQNEQDEPNGDSPKQRDDSPQYQPKKSGTFFVSSGFDKAVNIFSADDWALCKSLTGHDGTVLSVDVTRDARWIVSCGRDRTVKVWGRDDGGGI